jgi:cytochrome c2
MKQLSLIVTICLVCLIAVAGCAGSATQAPVAPAGPASASPAAGQAAPGSAPDGAALLNSKCQVCHTQDRIKTAKKTTPQWKDTVQRMIGKGAQLNASEADALVAYLAGMYR